MTNFNLFTLLLFVSLIFQLTPVAKQENASIFEQLFGDIKSDDQLWKIKKSTLYQFKQYTSIFNKSYKTDNQFQLSYDIFRKNVLEIAKSRIEFIEGKSLFKLGINQFADFSIYKLFTGLFSKVDRCDGKKQISSENDDTANNSKFIDGIIIDWRNRGNCVSEPQSQGPCGSCYAFAAASVLESAICIQNDNLETRLSVQQILDCSFNRYAYGCDGGHPYAVLREFAAQHSLIKRNCYPYKAKQGYCYEDEILEHDESSCKVELADRYHGYIVDSLDDEDKMLVHLIDEGPFAATLQTTQYFYLYEAGIYEEKCISEPTGYHGVTVVGAGQEKGIKYWIIKNSWNTTWGEQGFGRIRRGTNEMNITQLSSGLRYTKKDFSYYKSTFGTKFAIWLIISPIFYISFMVCIIAAVCYKCKCCCFDPYW